MAKDYFGNELKKGDKVVYILNRYKSFATGIVDKITDKRVFVVCENSGYITKHEHLHVIKIGNKAKEWISVEEGWPDTQRDVVFMDVFNILSNTLYKMISESELLDAKENCSFTHWKYID